MISFLRAQDFAIIEKVEARFDRRFTVLTGETGAGKSLIVDAVELALGGKADTSVIRTGSNAAKVEIVFDIARRDDVKVLARELGVEIEDSQLRIEREVRMDGRSPAKVSGRVQPLSIVRKLGTLLVDLHGQHAHQDLFDSTKHLYYLDQWIGFESSSLRAKVSAAFDQVQTLRKKLDAVRSGRTAFERRIGDLEYEVREIESAELSLGEFDRAQKLLERLKNVEKLAQLVASAISVLNEGDGAATDGMIEAAREIEAASKMDDDLGAIAETLRDAAEAAKGVALDLRDYAEDLDLSPTALEEAAARSELLHKLRRKYGDTEAAILARLDASRSELEELTSFDGDEETLVASLDEAEIRLQDLCSELSELRRAKAQEFGSTVKAELEALAMPRVIFESVFERKEPASDGADRVEFILSANIGEEARKLSKIASGGEASRVMLAIKIALAGRAGADTLIFDEVDSGLSGQAAVSVAASLSRLANDYQVISISHLPQIAGRADSHFLIKKVEAHGRTVAMVEPIEGEKRVDEMARMLSGEAVSQAAKDNARALIVQR